MAQPKRDVSALTLGVDKKRVEEIKDKIKEFRREILEMVSDDQDPEEVVLLAIQMLPVTNMNDEELVGAS